MTNKTINSLKLDEIINYLSYLTFSLIFAIMGRIWMSYKVSIDEFILNSFFFLFLIVGIIASLAYIDITNSLSERISIKINNFLLNKKIIKNQLKEGQQIVKSAIILEEENVNEIVTKTRREEENKKKEKLKVAINYATKVIAPYTTIDDLKLLLSYIKNYSEKGNLENIKPINIKELTVKDLKHFGWNLWNHFDRKVNQENIVLFLKKTFENKIGSIKTSSLKGNLTVDGNQGIIKIKNNLTKLDKDTID